MILQTAKRIANIRFHRSCGKLQNKLPYNLCNSVVIVISGCDVVSVGGNFGKRVCILKRDTRHFAKRQITWFKREKDVIWVNRPEFEGENAILADIEEQLRVRKIS